MRQGDRALEAVGRVAPCRSQEPAERRHDPRRAHRGQDGRRRSTTAPRPSELKATLYLIAGQTATRSLERPVVLCQPHACSSAVRACAAAPARSPRSARGSCRAAPRSRARADAARAAGARRCAVDRVAEDRPAHGGAMHAQLVGAAGERLEREPGEVVASLRLIGRSLPACGGGVGRGQRGPSLGIAPTLPSPQAGEGTPAACRGQRRSPGAATVARPSTFHVVTAGWPCGSGFIHQPRVASLRPSGRSMRPSSSAGPPSTTAQ